MASEAQIAANRANAGKSTGPRTAAGKAASRRNALKHGMTARTLVVFDETLEDLGAFHAALRAEYAPMGAAEEEIVERIIMAAWCLRRAWRAEAAMINAAALEAAAARARVAVRAALLADPPQGVYPEIEGSLEAGIEERLRAMTQEELLAHADEASVWPEGLAPLTRYQAHHERTLQRAKAELERHREAQLREAKERALRARLRAEAAAVAEERLAREPEAAPPGFGGNGGGGGENAERSQFQALRAALAPGAAPPWSGGDGTRAAGG